MAVRAVFRVRCLSPVVAASICICLIPGRALAQSGSGESSPGELGVALTFNGPADVNRRPDCDALNLPCLGSGKTFPDVGWVLVGSRNVTDRFAVTGEIGLFHNMWFSAPTASVLRSEDNIVHLAMIGPRIETPFRSQRGRRPSEARVFGQLLLGVAGGEVGSGGFAVQPGGGADIRFPNGVIFRMELDYSFVPGPGRNISGPRGLFGIVIGLGSRFW